MANFDISEQQKKLDMLMQSRRERVEKWREEQAKKKQTQKGDSNSNGAEKVAATPVMDVSNSGESQSNKKWTLDDEFNEEEEDETNVEPEVDDKEFIMPKKKDKLTSKSDNKESKRLNQLRKAFGNDEEDEEDEEESNLNKKRPVAMDLDEAPKKEHIAVKPSVNQDDGVEEGDSLEVFMKEVHQEVRKLRGTTHKFEKNKKFTMLVGVAKKANTTEDKRNKGEVLEQDQDGLEYSSGDEVDNPDDIETLNQNLQFSKQKKLTTISKEDITYMPFRKNFYVEVPELARMSHEEVDAYRKELEIEVAGKGCPKPIISWAQAGVHKKILENLKKLGYEKPTPIQAQAIPAIMCGRDLIGISKTGSGKTLAFLIPMLRHIRDQPELEPGDGPIAIIMAPTRELCLQIYHDCRKFARAFGLKTVAIYGGTPVSENIKKLRSGAEIVVCTPGRMIEMLAANSGRVTNTRRCTYLVIDEADRMFDLGFEKQLLLIIPTIRADRQTVMFSATFPRVMEALARKCLSRPIEITVGGRSIVCRDIEQHVEIIEEDDKFLKLLEILGRYLNSIDSDEPRSALVFVDRHENADNLLKDLMTNSYRCLALHAGIDQTDRDSTISDYKANKVNVLVATSVAARGLDVKHCKVVVNYDCPNHYEDYLHRCGRTGRAGNVGYAWTFITPDQGAYAWPINQALVLSGNPPNEKLLQMFERYKLQQEALGRTVKTGGGGGFSGKGFKFDEQEAQQINDKRKFQKVALGLQDSDDEDPDADWNKEIENMLAPKKTKQQLTSNNGNVYQTSNPALNAVLANLNKANAAASAVSVHEKLERAKRLASQISNNLGVKTTPGSVSFPTITSDSMLSGSLSAKSLAEQRAEKINAKLNYNPNEGDDQDNSGGSDTEATGATSGFERYEEELEINDFPQQARWRVTSKEAIAQIAEYSEAAITVRGNYVKPGARVNAETGERKLYLAIEGGSKLAVDKAKTEVVRLIKEELIKLKNSTLPANKARYKVWTVLSFSTKAGLQPILVYIFSCTVISSYESFHVC